MNHFKSPPIETIFYIIYSISIGIALSYINPWVGTLLYLIFIEIAVSVNFKSSGGYKISVVKIFGKLIYGRIGNVKYLLGFTWGEL